MESLANCGFTQRCDSAILLCCFADLLLAVACLICGQNSGTGRERERETLPGALSQNLSAKIVGKKCASRRNAEPFTEQSRDPKYRDCRFIYYDRSRDRIGVAQ